MLLKNGAIWYIDFAQCRVATKLQFVKNALSLKFRVKPIKWVIPVYKVRFVYGEKKCVCVDTSVQRDEGRAIQ